VIPNLHFWLAVLPLLISFPRHLAQGSEYHGQSLLFGIRPSLLRYFPRGLLFFSFNFRELPQSSCDPLRLRFQGRLDFLIHAA
jgi:hypothetical protein